LIWQHRIIRFGKIFQNSFREQRNPHPLLTSVPILNLFFPQSSHQFRSADLLSWWWRRRWPGCDCSQPLLLSVAFLTVVELNLEHVWTCPENIADSKRSVRFRIDPASVSCPRMVPNYHYTDRLCWRWLWFLCVHGATSIAELNPRFNGPELL